MGRDVLYDLNKLHRFQLIDRRFWWAIYRQPRTHADSVLFLQGASSPTITGGTAVNIRATIAVSSTHGNHLWRGTNVRSAEKSHNLGVWCATRGLVGALNWSNTWFTPIIWRATCTKCTQRKRKIKFVSEGWETNWKRPCFSSSCTLVRYFSAIVAILGGDCCNVRCDNYVQW